MTAAPTELAQARARIAELEKALEPFANIRFDVDGFSFDMADIVFEDRLLATFKTTMDHGRFGHAVAIARAALAGEKREGGE